LRLEEDAARPASPQFKEAQTMHTDLFTLANIDAEIIPIVAIVGGLSVAVVAIVGKMIGGIHRTRQREESRREIAAYIAEGSMTPEDGMELLQAGAKDDRKCGL
jgi:hypothetical protein